MKILNNKKYVLQHIYTLEYFMKQKTGFLQRAEYTFTKNRSEANEFTNEEAITLISATATDNGKDNEKDFQILETLKAIEV